MKYRFFTIGRLLIVCIIAVVLAVAWFHHLPLAEAKMTPVEILTGEAPVLNWPGSGQAALGIRGYGVVEHSGDQTPAPMASVAKVFTAIAVLKKHPLEPGQQGPTITITRADVDSYENYYTQGGSLAAVSLGEKISERQALEAMLLPSANNFADTLARWAFGSTDNYVTYINNLNKSLGLKNTHIAGASGFNPGTVSTATDLVKIGNVAINDPVLATIVSEPYAYVPVAGQIHNTNWLLGTNNINGIKTGNTEEAGGCYLFSSVRNINGKPVTVIGAVMGSSDLTGALTAGRDLLATVDGGFMPKVNLQPGTQVGYYKMAWGQKVPIVTKNSLDLIGWGQKKPSLNYSASPITSVAQGQSVGRFYATSGFEGTSTELVAKNSSNSPPWRWRLYQRYL